MDGIIALGVVSASLLTCVSTVEALSSGTCARLSTTLIHLSRSSLHYLIEVSDGRVDSSYIGSLMGILELLESLLDTRLLVSRNLVAVVLKEILGCEDH